MKPVNVLLSIVAVLAIVFVILNWGMLGGPILVSFGFAHVSVPLGLVLLGLAVVLIAVFFGLLLTVQFRLLAAHRRHSAELRAQRELVDNAEASRFTELRQYLNQELAAFAATQRLSEQHLREEIQATSNTLSACIGEIHERLERQWPMPPEAHV
ncbi:MAG TPA: hypothetical protein VN757_06725 [Steroidobacteraceae bacterium]|nr:hypothetical protein [Steroidobacteraceae bacterium]